MSYYDTYKQKLAYASKLEEEEKKRYAEQQEMAEIARQVRAKGDYLAEYHKPTEVKLQEQADEAARQRDEYANSGEYVNLWKTLKPGDDLTFSDWRASKTKMNQLNTQAEEAQNAASAYRAFQKQQEIKKLSADEIQARMNELEQERAQSGYSASGIFEYFGRALSGDAAGASRKADELRASKARANEIDSEIASYRQVYSDKRSEEEIEKLPDNVVKLLDEYNSVGYEQEYDKWGTAANALTGGSSYSNDMKNAETVSRKIEIADKLKSMGYDNYEELAEYRRYITEKEIAQQDEQEWEKFASEHPGIAWASARALKPAANITGTIGSLQSLDDKTDINADAYSPYYYLTKGTNKVDETISDSFEDGVLSKTQKALLYATATSGVDSLIASTMGNMGGTVLGMGAMNDTVIDMTEKGASKSQALMGGIAAGTFETLFENVSIGQLNAMKEFPVTSVKNAVANIGKSVLTNFSEEAATEIANITYDYLVNGGISDYATLVQGYIDDGLSEEEARRKASVDMGKRVGDAGLSGALMGGAFGAVGSVSGRAGYNAQMVSDGREIADAGNVEMLLATAYGIDPETSSTLYKLANKVENTEKARIAESEQQSTEGENANSNTQELKYKTRQLRNIGKLSEAVSKKTESDVRKIATEAVKKRLTELGETDSDVMSAAVVKMLSGEKLSRSERSAIAENTGEYKKNVKAVVDEWQNGEQWVADMNDSINDLVYSRENPDIEAYRNRNSASETDSKAAEFGSDILTENGGTIEQVMEANADKYTKGGIQTAKTIYREGQDPTSFERGYYLFYEAGKSGMPFEAIDGSGIDTPDFDSFQQKKAYEMGEVVGEIGKRSKLVSISSITDNDVTVKDSEGNEISLAQVDAAPETIRVFKEAATYGDTETANIFIKNWHPGSNFNLYSDSFKVFYLEGMNTELPFDEFIKNGQHKELLKGFSKDTAELAFEQGRKTVQNLKTPQKKKVAPKTTKRAKGRYVNEAADESEISQVYSAISRKIGIDIVRQDSLFTPDGIEANAKFIVDSFRVIISANAQSEFTDTAHELTHATTTYAAERYKQVADAIISYAKQQSIVDFEDRIGEIMQIYGVDRQEAFEEFVCEEMGSLFSTDKGVNDFLSWLQTESGYSKEERKTIIQRIVEILDKIVDAIKTTIKNGHLSSIAKQGAQMQEDRASEIRQLFFKALEEAGENYRKNGAANGEANVKYSLKLSDTDSVGNALSKEQQEFFKNVSDELKDKNGRIKPFYHGTSRADRVGYYFDPERATSGPMAYFTDNKEIAGNYSRDKSDTSISYDEKYDSYETQFRYEKDGDSIPIADYWYKLPLKKRNEIAKKAEQIRFDWDADNGSFIVDENAKYGNGGYDIRYAKGNALQALVDAWLVSGDLYGEESMFMEVLTLAGLDTENIKYYDPDFRDEKVYECYLNITNPIVTANIDNGFIEELKDYISNTDMSIYENDNANADMWDKNRWNIDDWIERLQDDVDNGTFYVWTSVPDVVTDFLKSQGYDGIIDTGGKGGGNSHTVAIPFYSNQIKSIDNENPTSENPDIRYSLGLLPDVMKITLSLLKQNEEYERIISDLELQIKNPDFRHIIEFDKCRGIAVRLKQHYMSTINTEELMSLLGDFYNFVANSKELSGDVLHIKTREIAEKILSKSKHMNPDITDEAKAILKDIREVGVTLNEVQRQEVANSYGSYNNFRKAVMGSIKVVNNGVPLDTRWAELAEQYPGIFDKDVSDADQGILLFETVKALRNTYSDDSGFDYDSAVDMLSGEIWGAYFEVPETKLLSAEYARKVAKIKTEYSEKLDEMRANYKKRYRQQIVSELQSGKTNPREIKKGGIINGEVAKNIARLHQKVQYLENREDVLKHRRYIDKRVKRLSRLVLNPSKQASAVYEKDGQKTVIVNSIPEALRKPAATICEIFAENGGVFDYKKIDELLAGYRKIKANSPTEETSVSGMYDEDIADSIEKLKNTIDGKRLVQLNVNELVEVRNILDHFITMVKNETEIFVNGRKQYVENVGGQALDEIQGKGNKKILTIFDKDVTKPGRKLAVQNLKPWYFFERVGGVLKSMYNGIRKGQDDYVRNIEPAKDFLSQQIKKYNAKGWLDDKAKKFKTERGEELELTTQQKMLIYATAKREQISGQESEHLMTGGVVFENQIEKSSEKDSNKPWQWKKNDADTHPLSLGDIIKIADSLTDEQKAFADSLVGYLSKEMAELGNEVSMKIYGYRKFTEQYYIPFNSANTFGYQRFGEQGETLLRALSFTKQTVHGAATPLVLSDFTEVWARHVERMSAYNAFVIPLENFAKVWNYKTVQEETDSKGEKKYKTVSVASAFKTAFGAEYSDYITQFIKDVNGNIMTDKREDTFNKLVSLYKKNAVLASASVMIQQPSAVARALALVNPKYFAKTTFKKRKAAYEECMKYAPVAVLKEVGGFDTTSGRNMVDWLLQTEPEGGKGKLAAFFKDSQFRDDVLGWGPQWADRVTWAHIWLACKAEQAAIGYTGNTLLEKTADRFAEVIDRTQVYDSVLSRSSLMRSKSNTLQAVTAFMGEPTTTANMMADAIIKGKQGQRTYCLRALSAIVGATLLNAALKSIVTAGRDKDEDEDPFEKYFAQLISNFLQDMNPLSLVPFIRDVMSLLQGYDVERADVSVIADLVGTVFDLGNDNISLSDKITGILGSIGAFVGIPAKNIIRDFNTIVNTYKGLKGNTDASLSGALYALDDELFPILRNAGVDVVKKKTKAERIYQYWNSGNKEMYNRFAAQYNTGTQIRSAIKGVIKEKYLNEEISEDEAGKQLGRLGFDENEAYYEIRGWKAPDDEEDDDTEDDYAYLKDYSTVNEGKTNDEDNEEEKSAYAKYEFLDAAVKSGDTSQIKSEVDDLIAHGIEQSKIDSRLKSAIRKYDTQVQSAAEKYANNDLSDFDSTVSSVAAKYNIDKSIAAGAIRSEAGVSYSAVDGTYYAMADVYAAMESGNNEKSRAIVQEIVEAKTQEKINEGKNRTEAYNSARSSVRSSISSKWKERYLEGDAYERNRIKAMLYYTGAWDSLVKLEETLRTWRTGK